MAQVQIMLPEERSTVLHVGRTTLAAVISQVLAHALHMPEPYWATVTTIVVMHRLWVQHGKCRSSGLPELLWAQLSPLWREHISGRACSYSPQRSSLPD